jgi:hypothetical protein
MRLLGALLITVWLLAHVAIADEVTQSYSLTQFQLMDNPYQGDCPWEESGCSDDLYVNPNGSYYYVNNLQYWGEENIFFSTGEDDDINTFYLPAGSTINFATLTDVGVTTSLFESSGVNASVQYAQVEQTSMQAYCGGSQPWYLSYNLPPTFQPCSGPLTASLYEIGPPEFGVAFYPWFQGTLIMDSGYAPTPATPGYEYGGRFYADAFPEVLTYSITVDYTPPVPEPREIIPLLFCATALALSAVLARRSRA